MINHKIEMENSQKISITNQPTKTNFKKTKMPCSTCHETGHNKRSCPIEKKTLLGATGSPRTEKKALQSKPNKETPETQMECSICMDNIGKTNRVTTACNHTFCFICLLEALKHKNSCPLCRAEIKKDEKSQKPLTPQIAQELIEEEMDQFPIEQFIRAAFIFGDPRTIIRTMVRIYSVDLLESAAIWQEGEDWEPEENSDSDDSDASSGVDEAPINRQISQFGSNLIE